MDMKRIFLLGGRDLEMLTIRELLQSCAIKFFDKNLTWDTALLSAYSEELCHYENQDCQIVGIELREDIMKPNNYVLIDHHNNCSDCLSSLEQVSSLLDVKLDRWQQLVAINDRGYINGLRKFGASEDEIGKVRRADREAQGVTQEEDFGCIGLIMVFVGFADVLVDSGLGRALVFKKNPTNDDYATVFTSNLLISIVLFSCIFFAAPAIGRYVGVPKLGLYLRVESVAVLIRAFYLIQSSVLTRDLRFKDLSVVSIFAHF